VRAFGRRRGAPGEVPSAPADEPSGPVEEAK
jgi:hypothetical protein